MSSVLSLLNEHGELPGGKTLHPGSIESFPYTQRIKSLLQRGEIKEAQHLYMHAKDLIQDQRLHKALAPPRIRVSSREPGPDRSAEFRWLDSNSDRFRGRWVALLGERLVASADSLKELLVELKPMTLEGKPLVHHVD